MKRQINPSCKNYTTSIIILCQKLCANLILKQLYSKDNLIPVTEIAGTRSSKCPTGIRHILSEVVLQGNDLAVMEIIREV